MKFDSWKCYPPFSYSFFSSSEKWKLKVVTCSHNEAAYIFLRSQIYQWIALIQLLLTLLLRFFVAFHSQAILSYRVFDCCKRSYARLVHLLLQLLGTACVTVGFYVTFMHTHNQAVPHFRSVHTWLALATCGLFVFQVTWQAAIQLNLWTPCKTKWYPLLVGQADSQSRELLQLESSFVALIIDVLGGIFLNFYIETCWY